MIDSADLVRLLDALEDTTDGYVTLEIVERAAGCDLASAIAETLLLVDHRTREDGTPVTICRLNRHHPLVKELTGW